MVEEVLVLLLSKICEEFINNNNKILSINLIKSIILLYYMQNLNIIIQKLHNTYIISIKIVNYSLVINIGI